MHRDSHQRTYQLRTSASTQTLVHDVTLAAQMGARSMRWPAAIPKVDAAQVAHAVAATMVHYRADGDQQNIQLPWISLHGTGDCKSTAVLIASLCAAAGQSVRLCFLQYRSGPTWWEHVFCIVDGVPVDPLLPFGQQFPYLRCTYTTVQ